MAWRPHPRHARTDPTSPRGWATDMRSGFVGNLENMVWQYEFRGLGLYNTQVLTLPEYADEPNRQLGSVILPPDPPGLLNARPEAYPADEYWPRLLQNGAPRYMQNQNNTLVTISRSLQYSKYFS